MNEQHDISTPLMRAFTYAWSAIQRKHPEVPNVVITLGAGTSPKERGQVLGHFAPYRWTRDTEHIHELFIGGEGLAAGGASVMATLLHEAAHGVALARNEQDVSRGGRYHNKRFKAIGEEMGLELALDPRSNGIGWSLTTMPESTAKGYAAAIKRLDASIVAYRKGGLVVAPVQPGKPGEGEGEGEGEGAPTGKGRGRASNDNGLSLSCECDKPRKIRVSKTVAALGDIRCGICGGLFEVRS